MPAFKIATGEPTTVSPSPFSSASLVCDTHPLGQAPNSEVLKSENAGRLVSVQKGGGNSGPPDPRHFLTSTIPTNPHRHPLGGATQRAMEESSPPAVEELPEEAPWAPRMDAIRKAQLAETAALEQVFEALGSKQHSSISKLSKQMDAMLAWKMKVTRKNRELEATGKDRNLAARREAAKTSVATKEITGGTDNSTPGNAAEEESADQREVPSLLVNEDDSEDSDEPLGTPIEQGT